MMIKVMLKKALLRLARAKLLNYYILGFSCHFTQPNLLLGFLHF
ncbi:Uncharacterised protein [Streptococcus mutans]|uniref:Uncharacterized protein n=1 Tax=Streptococcus ratti FA-1 = DSM 20564 TaxID=699248 RepID=A0ABN0GVM0_STRRT|nr:hypothetical protein SRA_08531 [Streptococcus ratti FA-1 = DSM 20564]VEI60843.1 Uncharacterised protein [Streptococcus mutans]